MTDISRLKRHAELMNRMAAALGVDLEEAVLRGDVDMGEIADAVLRCSDCSNPAHCSLWLEAQTDEAEDTPGYCRNRELLRELRARLRR